MDDFLSTVAADAAALAAAPTDHAVVERLALRYLDLVESIAEREAAIAEFKREAEQILTRDLPDAMRETGAGDTVQLRSGTQVTLKPIVSGSIPKKNRPAAHAWLRANGQGDLIKIEMTVAAGKGQHGAGLLALAAQARACGWAVTTEETVHAETLKKFVRTAVAAGRTLPLDTLGIFVGQRAEVALPQSDGDTPF